MFSPSIVRVAVVCVCVCDSGVRVCVHACVSVCALVCGEINVYLLLKHYCNIHIIIDCN